MATIRDYTWSDDQLRAMRTTDTSVIVSASAGSGKTTLMIGRILNLIEQGAELERMLVVTFATAQADDMKNKLATHLAELANVETDPELATRFRKQGYALSAASISTLHSYCADLVRRHAYAKEVSPTFAISNETDTEIRASEAVEAVIRAELQKGDKVFLALYDALSKKRSHADLAGLIRRIASLAATLPSGDVGELSQGADALAQSDVRWYVKLLADNLLRQLADFERQNPILPPYVAEHLQLWREWAKSGGSAAFPEKKLTCPKAQKDEDDPALKEAFAKLRDDCKKEVRAALDTLSFPDADPSYAQLAIRLAKDYQTHYNAAKRADDVLDFNDLERLAYEMLSDPVIARTERERYDYVFVDEFQDINPIQQGILSALSRDNVFMVGDVKQSIYGFRLCDSAIFEEQYARMDAKNTAIDLNINYRSSKGILAFCNFVFSQLYTEELGGIDYANRACFQGGAEDVYAPSVELHFVERAEWEEDVVADGVYSVADDAECADSVQAGYEEGRVIANRITELVQTGVRYGDIAVLARTMKEDTFAVIDALRDAGIPVALRRDHDLMKSPCVCALINLLRVLVNPRQDYALVGVMTSKLFSFTENELAQIRLSESGIAFHEAVRKYPASEKKEPRLSGKVQAMFEALARWRALSRYETPYAVLTTVLRDTDYLNAVFSTHDGAVEHDLVLYFLRELNTSRHNVSAVSYLEFVASCSSLTVELTEGAEDAVTVTTMHKSKGLEYEVVFLARLGKQFNDKSLSGNALVTKRYGLLMKNFDFAERTFVKNSTIASAHYGLMRELLEEEMRVLYVAMTRAKRLLVAVGTVAFQEHYQALTPVTAFRAKSPLEWLLGVITTDSAKQGSLPFRSVDGRVAPCDYAVTVHSPTDKTDRLAPPVVVGADDELAARLKEYWEKPYPYATDTLKKTTATIRANAVDVTVARDSEGFLRDGDATEVGNAYHAVMEQIDFTQDVGRELTRLKEQGLVSEAYLALVDAERIALACKAMTALGGTVKRELAFLTSVSEADLYGAGDGTVIVQGIIDALVEQDDGVIIVDYKTTDASAEYLRARYAPQLKTYADACAAAGLHVKKTTIWSFVKNAWVDCDGEQA